jgi:EmrB/QacA subfamily drug resistance transporter
MYAKQDDKTMRTVALAASVITGFMVPFMSSSINVALPAIGDEFALDAITLGWIGSVYLLFSAMFMVPIGRIADIYGRKKILLWGVIVFTVFSLLSALAPSAIFLIVCRAFQGIGAAMVLSVSIALLTSIFPQEERGRILGIMAASVYIGLSVGPVLGGIITQWLGWRFIFVFSVIMGVVAIIMILWKLKGEWAEAKGENFDIAGSVIFCISLFMVIFGFSQLPEYLGLWLIIAGIIMIVLFVWWETRTKSPVLNINLFRGNLAFSFSNLAALINYAAVFGVGFLMSLYLQYIRGLPPATAGLILIAQPVMVAILSPIAGKLSDRMEPRVVASAGMALSTVGLVMLIFLGEYTSVIYIILSLIIIGTGFGLFSSPNNNAIMSAVDKRYYGVASGTLGTVRSIGQAFSLGIALLIFAIFIGRVQITPEFYDELIHSTRMAFIVFAALCFAGIFISLTRSSRKNQSESI